jgi:TRAP-type C4-dicarboxylate transport system permease small subunit
MMFMIVMDIFTRSILKTSFFGIHDLIQFLLLIAIFSSISYCWVVDGHVRMRFLHAKLKERGKAVLDALAALCGIFVFGLLVIACIKFLIVDFELKNQTDLAHIPFYPFRIFMIAGSLLFVIQATISLIDSIRRIKFSKPRDGKNP